MFCTKNWQQLLNNILILNSNPDGAKSKSATEISMFLPFFTNKDYVGLRTLRIMSKSLRTATQKNENRG